MPLNILSSTFFLAMWTRFCVFGKLHSHSYFILQRLTKPSSEDAAHKRRQQTSVHILNFYRLVCFPPHSTHSVVVAFSVVLCFSFLLSRDNPSADISLESVFRPACVSKKTTTRPSLSSLLVHTATLKILFTLCHFMHKKLLSVFILWNSLSKRNNGLYDFRGESATVCQPHIHFRLSKPPSVKYAICIKQQTKWVRPLMRSHLAWLRAESFAIFCWPSENQYAFVSLLIEWPRQLTLRAFFKL